MKIVKLVAENVKGLKAVEIVPDDNLQLITGANGQGKSSVMDSIWLALGGSDASRGSNTTRPIRDGEKTAVAQVDLGDIIVTRKWTANDKSTLKVESKEGAQFKSPQSMLNELIGKLSFDPLSFSNLDDKKQLETLLGMVKLSQDPAVIENEKKKVFAERTIVNREVKNLKAQLEAFPVIGEDVPDEEVRSTDIINELQKAQEVINHNNSLRKAYSDKGVEYNQVQSDIEYIQSEIARLREQLDDAEFKLEEKLNKSNTIVEEGKKLQAQIESVVDPDLSVFNQKLSEVDDINAKVREKKKIAEVEKQYNKAITNAEGLTFQLEDLEKQKQDLIKSAQFPIEGLSFNEDGVLYNGVPFKQCSSAERLRVSMAMAMALNPKLRVIRILDGSLLDSNNLKLISDMARDGDYQVWVEQVDESGKVGIVIENGEVKPQ